MVNAASCQWPTTTFVVRFDKDGRPYVEDVTTWNVIRGVKPMGG